MRTLPLGVVAVLLAGPAVAQEEPALVELRVLVEQAIHESRPEDVDNLVEMAANHASAANRPVRLGRIELFGAVVEADHPNARTVEQARKAQLHLAGDPDAEVAALRFHTAAAMVAIEAGRLGATALHLQQGRAALSRLTPAQLAAPEGGKPLLGVPEPRRDQERLDRVERQLLPRLRQVLVDAHGDVQSVPAGVAAALSSIATGQPMRADPGGLNPLPPRVRPPADQVLGRLDRALLDAEEREIAQTEQRGDGKAAASARSRHAESLLRAGQKAEAIKVRRQALAWYREQGTIEQVVGEARWIAERAGGDRRATFVARQEEVREIERQVARLAGPARSAARVRYHADFVALCEAALPLLGDRPGGRGAAVELLEPFDLLRERGVWDQAALLADADRWKRLGPAATEARRQLEAVAQGDVRRESGPLVDFSSPLARARQRAMDQVARGEPQAPPPLLDAEAVVARLGSRALVIFARMDADRLAVAVLPGEGRGPPRVAFARLTLDEELQLVAALRRGLHDGGDAWREPARALYGALLAPVEASLGEGAVLIPDEALAALPFAALEDGAGRLVGQRLTMALSPSLAALGASPAPALDRGAALVLGVSRFAEPRALPLPAAEREVAAIRGALEGSGRRTRVLPQSLSPQQLLAEAGRFDVVHLASRVRLDGETPLLGALLLNTAALPLFDLGRALLRANVLALHTPPAGPELPAMAAARGLSGVAGAALQGPARSVVLALLPAEGASGAVLLTRFYERYATGQSPSGALASAQREMAAGSIEQPLFLAAGANPIGDRHRFTHPRFWAGFAVWGEP